MWVFLFVLFGVFVLVWFLRFFGGGFVFLLFFQLNIFWFSEQTKIPRIWSYGLTLSRLVICQAGIICFTALIATMQAYEATDGTSRLASSRYVRTRAEWGRTGRLGQLNLARRLCSCLCHRASVSWQSGHSNQTWSRWHHLCSSPLVPSLAPHNPTGRNNRIRHSYQQQ